MKCKPFLRLLILVSFLALPWSGAGSWAQAGNGWPLIIHASAAPTVKALSAVKITAAKAGTTKTTEAWTDKKAWTVMTFNIRHGVGLDGKSNIGRVVKLIRSSGARVIGLQEVDRGDPRSGFRDEIAEIAQRLSMNWCFAPSIRIGTIQYGDALLTDYPIISAHIYALSGDEEPRTLLDANLQTGLGQVHVLVTHLGLTEHERYEQMPIVEGIMKQIDGPALFIGDMNMDAVHPLLANLPSPWTKLTLNVPSGTVLNGREIDHVFVNREVSDTNVYTLDTDASDHVPVVARFKW